MPSGQMSLWQLVSAKDGPRILPLKFGKNRVSNSWDIANIEFLVVGWWGLVVRRVIFVSNPTFVMLGGLKLWSRWGCDNCLLKKTCFCWKNCPLKKSILSKEQIFFQQKIWLELIQFISCSWLIYLQLLWEKYEGRGIIPFL